MESEKESLQSIENWDLVIKPSSGYLNLHLGDVWRYRDLLMMFVKRDIVTVYKQTILGPVWFVIQPILTTLIYIIVFGNIAGISTNGIPKILFYLSGIIIWNYFAESFNATSNTFRENEALFGKVYFPRLLAPLSKVISGLIKFGIQFCLFIAIGIYYAFTGYTFHFTSALLLLPVLIIIMAMLGLAAGIIFTSLTAKYRDLSFLIAFGVQLLMYATPVIYPLSSVPEKYKVFIQVNPITPVVEGFRYILLGSGTLSVTAIGYSAAVTIILFLTGLLIFNRTEKTFMDTV